jgi:hypothetical protein
MDNVIDILDKRYYFTEREKAKLRENRVYVIELFRNDLGNNRFK